MQSMVWLKEISLKEKKLRKRGKEREREIPTTAGYLGGLGGGGGHFPNLQALTALHLQHHV